MGKKRKPSWRSALKINVPERVWRQIVQTECVLFYCMRCPHILIERGRARNKKCPKCKGDTTYCYGDNLDEAATRFRENIEFDGKGMWGTARPGVAKAIERFQERQADRYRADKAADGDKDRGYFIYRKLQKHRLEKRSPMITGKKAVGEARSALAKNKKRLDKKKGGGVFGESLPNFRKKK